MIRAWWSTAPRPGNLGDVLAPVILRGLGVDVTLTGRASADLLAIGSIVRFARPGQRVWGSGAMWASDAPSPRAAYLAVRGPLTREIVQREGGDCPEVYGDPALLLPRIHNAPVEKVHDTGLVPHYVDNRVPGRPAIQPDSQVRAFRDGPVIDSLRADPLVVVDEIRACRAILSSSLHGIIVAHAYGIPAAWVKLSDRLSGDDTKFRDYAASVGVELTPYGTLDAAVPVLGSIDTAPLLVALDALR